MSYRDITFNIWDDSDEEGILALVRRNYGDYDTSHAEYFDWEYRRNPLGRAIIGCGKAPDGTVVTALATVPTPVIFRGTAVMACQLVNGMTHPDYLGRGLFSECGRMVVSELKKAGIALSYGFPNPNSFPSLTRNIGYSGIGRARLMAFLHRPAALASARFPAARIFGAAGIDQKVMRLFFRKPSQKMPVQMRASFNSLPMAGLREKAEVVIDTNIDWLNWRYVGVPRREYKIVSAGDESNPLGVAVYRVSLWENVRIGTLNEFFIPSEYEPDAAESLLSHVLTECENSGCASTFCLVSPGSRKEEILKRSGFVTLSSRFEPQPFSVILMGHSIATAGITVNDMAVSFGAYDVF
jgi:hypothetical protein